MKDKLLAIDPGNEVSAYLVTDFEHHYGFGILPNEELKCRILGSCVIDRKFSAPRVLAIEMTECFGKPAGNTVLHTTRWVGKFELAFEVANPVNRVCLVHRSEIKLHLCLSRSAKDCNIRQVLIDRYGEPGKKGSENPLTYGISKDVWSVLAIATYWRDMRRFENRIKKAA